MVTWLEDIATVIENAGLGTIDVDMFLGVMPDAQSVPGACLAIEPTPGDKTVLNYDGSTTKYPHATMHFRDDQNLYLPPLTRAFAVFTLLDGLFAVTMGENFYKMIEPLQSPYGIGPKDDTGRWNIGFNVRVHANQ